LECENLGGFLAEIKNQEQSTLLTSLAFVEETITGVESWWIGLTDQGHEGRWIWQHSVEDVSFTNWAEGNPDGNHANDDCALITLKDNFMWSDASCTSLVASPVCQRETSISSTTPPYSTTTTPPHTTTSYPRTTTTDYNNRIELHGGDDFSFGNVFAVNREGYFGPVCDDGWGADEATVVCKQLGFNSGSARTESTWGSVPSFFAMDEVNCIGNERALQDCSYSAKDDCGSNEGAGVICSF